MRVAKVAPPKSAESRFLAIKLGMYFNASGVSMMLMVSAIFSRFVLSTVLGIWYFSAVVRSAVTLTGANCSWAVARLIEATSMHART